MKCTKYIYFSDKAVSAKMQYSSQPALSMAVVSINGVSLALFTQIFPDGSRLTTRAERRCHSIIHSWHPLGVAAQLRHHVC